MQTVLFTIVNWDTQEEADQLKPILKEWNDRSNAYFDPYYKCLIAGSYSNPDYNPCPEINLIQTGFEKQFFPKTPINYWKIGLMTALHQFSQYSSWDLVVYYHYCLLTSIDIKEIYSDFLSSSKSMCALNRTTYYGTVMDTGLMIMKRSAVQKWILNSSAGFAYDKNGKSLSVEREAQTIFEGDIYNPFPKILSMHRYQSGAHENNDLKENPFNKRFDLTREEFINNPIVFGYKHHCSESELNEWKLKHPIKK